jgi:UrcA family protein
MIRLILPAALLLATAAPVIAQDEPLPTRAVQYGDLNLASADGVAAFHRRVQTAARALCGDANVRDLDILAEVQRCRHAAINSGETKVAMLVANAQRVAMRSASVQIADR